MERATFEQLLSGEGQAVLAEVGASNETELALATRLRRRHAPELVSAAFALQALRIKAVSKFGQDAHRLYFTPDALEQATRANVARHRAERLASHGVSRVVDLGCGIGADLIAFARAGLEVRGVDLDPVRVAVANANLAALGLAGEVLVGDAESTVIRPGEVAFIDPARRTGRGRTFRLAELSPSWPFVVDLLKAGRAVAKVMPGIAHDAIPSGVEAEWVSDRGDLVEACLWGTDFSGAGSGGTGTRRATVLPAGFSMTSRSSTPRAGDVRAHLIEPDDAVIRAGLVAEFAEAVGGTLVDPHIAYVTTDLTPAQAGGAAAAGRWFGVLEPLPFHEKPLRAALRARDIGSLTIKKRGVDVVPERLAARLKLTGSVHATLIMTRVAGRGRAFLVTPLGGVPAT